MGVRDSASRGESLAGDDRVDAPGGRRVVARVRTGIDGKVVRSDARSLGNLLFAWTSKENNCNWKTVYFLRADFGIGIEG